MKRKRADVLQGSNNATAAQRKKKRTDAAREISVQGPNPGSSKLQNVQGMSGLPSAIDVEKFAEARAFEIRSMEEAMVNASEGATHRAWQTLPRHLRRRAASHDVRRVPARLREKAKAEMDRPAKASAKKKLPKRGKEKRLTRTEELLKRQNDKTWLETHIWHAKRMKMENMWGYRLAVTPTEKSYRPSHRASLHGCIIHDASYEAIIEVSGPEKCLRKIISSCCDPQAVGPCAARYANGVRVCNTHMYKANEYPRSLLGPVTVIWKTAVPVSFGTVDSASISEAGGKQIESMQRFLWIRCHPTLYDQVIASVKEIVQSQLSSLRETTSEAVSIEVADLREQFNIFELIGPKASQVIHGVLKPVAKDKRTEFKKFWTVFGQVQNAGSAPRGMIIGGQVYDPRLSFPPKNTKVTATDDQHNEHLLEGLWPTSKLACSEIWDEKIRESLSKPHFKKQDLDARRSKLAVPGSKLPPSSQDDLVPFLLIQRSIEPHPERSDRNLRPMHGWTLILPKGWGMPVFSSLIYTGTRIAGQREIQTQYFEAGCPSFPRDYVCTLAYSQHIDERAKKDKATWLRKPPAKRPSWKKLDTRSPWKPDWEIVLGLKASHELVPTQRNTASEEHADSDSTDLWVLRGPEVPAFVEFLSHCADPSAALLAKVNEWRSKLSIASLPITLTSALYHSALLSVHLVFPKSGSPEDNAMVYIAQDDEARQWIDFLDAGHSGDVTEEELSSVKSSSDSIIGYITSGNFSLSSGRGRAIGAISLRSYVSLKEQLHRIGKASSQPLVKVRNRGGDIYRAAHVEII